jgi:hypothetical protein
LSLKTTDNLSSLFFLKCHQIDMKWIFLQRTALASNRLNKTGRPLGGFLK